MTVIGCHIVKSMTFRGKAERWENGYLLQTTSTIDTAFLKSVCDALVTMERNFHYSSVTFPYRVAGVLGQAALYAEEVSSPPAGLGTVQNQHPEVCVLAQSQIGPKKYLMKYYHGAGVANAGLSDVLNTTQKTTIDTNLVKLTDGTLPGLATYCRPNGALATVPFTCDPFLRVHQLKRRGKRR